MAITIEEASEELVDRVSEDAELSEDEARRAVEATLALLGLITGGTAALAGTRLVLQRSMDEAADLIVQDEAHRVSLIEVKTSDSIKQTASMLREMLRKHGRAEVVAASGTLAGALAASFAGWQRQQRRHGDLMRALMPAEVDLPSVASLLQARRNIAARTELLEEFGALTSAEVADLAGSRASNRAALANRWRSEGRIFSVPVGDQQLYPVFEFSDDGRPLPVMAEVLSALRESDALSDWQLALWFTGANGRLGGARPVDLLEEDPAAVATAASQEASEVVG